MQDGDRVEVVGVVSRFPSSPNPTPAGLEPSPPLKMKGLWGLSTPFTKGSASSIVHACSFRSSFWTSFQGCILRCQVSFASDDLGAEVVALTSIGCPVCCSRPKKARGLSPSLFMMRTATLCSSGNSTRECPALWAAPSSRPANGRGAQDGGCWAPGDAAANAASRRTSHRVPPPAPAVAVAALTQT